MDCKGLAERLRTESLYKDKATLEIMDMCMEAAEKANPHAAGDHGIRGHGDG